MRVTALIDIGKLDGWIGPQLLENCVDLCAKESLLQEHDMHARRHLPRPGHRQSGPLGEIGDVRVRRLGLDYVDALRLPAELDGLDHRVAGGRAKADHQSAGLGSDLDGG
jgi:hypothetical protein